MFNGYSNVKGYCRIQATIEILYTKKYFRVYDKRTQPFKGAGYEK